MSKVIEVELEGCDEAALTSEETIDRIEEIELTLNRMHKLMDEADFNEIINEAKNVYKLVKEAESRSQMSYEIRRREMQI